ncbi:hypothetical protein HZR84_02330 [Hyphobacterium sp. CCMP332]|nr:hypothetical protein HZR84_02330 [Hyphobacterium sp. CCMP332]
MNANLLFAIGILLIPLSCNDDNDFLILDVVPQDIFKVYPIDEPVIFFTRSQSSTDNLSRFTIAVREENEVNRSIVFDSAISGSFFEYNFGFPRPLDQSREYDFEFKVYTSDGKSTTQFRSALIIYDSLEVPLTETTGHRIYPKLTQNPDGFDLINRVAVFTDTALLDTNTVDIYELADTTVNLTRIWRSNTNGKFVRFNGFDYPNATLSKLIEAYESGQKLDQMINIQEDDIIIFHSSERAVYAAIKIDEIESGDSVTNAFYEFNLKK